MGEDNSKKIGFGFKMPEIPKIDRTFYYPDTSYLDEAVNEIKRAKEEKINREKNMEEAMLKLVEMAKENPAMQQHIQTLVQNNGTINNMQTVHTGATGVQNITNNTGINAEEVIKLLGTMRELTDVMDDETAEQTREVIDDLSNEVQQPEPKKGRIKASLAYLKNLFSDIIVNPSKSIAKAQYTAYANGKATEIVEGIDTMIDSII